MATMVKEKRKEKKNKAKEKHVCSTKIETETSNTPINISNLNEIEDDKIISSSHSPELNKLPHTTKQNKVNNTTTETNASTGESLYSKNNSEPLDSTSNIKHVLKEFKEKQFTFSELNTQLEQNLKLGNTHVEDTSEIKIKETMVETSAKADIKAASTTETEESVCPSAPMLEDNQQVPKSNNEQTLSRISASRIECMPLEEAINLFGGKVINEIRMLSEREAAIVEAGPMTGPEHPLVDLLSNFKCSLNTIERSRNEIAQGFLEEDKFRSRLWKIEKRNVFASGECVCGESVEVQVKYDYAEFQNYMLPVAKLKLESLLRDTQHSYCHHLHSALLTHCQIEELIAETVKSANKTMIREALSLIMTELRLANIGLTVHSAALERWAQALAAAVIDGQDIRQLLFVMHHLFRQSRSISWVANLIQLPAADNVDVARIIALMDLFLCGSRVDTALECLEVEDVWEEVDYEGDAGAVCEGSMRERDLIAIFEAFPLADIIARLSLLRSMDMSQPPHDGSGGHHVVVCVRGTRCLLQTVRRVLSTHAQYGRLRSRLRGAAASVGAALADLHLQCRSSYTKELAPMISAEMNAVFAATFSLCADSEPIEEVPFRMLEPDIAMNYCIGFMVMLHETETKPIPGTESSLPRSVPCAARVNLAGTAAVQRLMDADLANNVLLFLFQVSFKKNKTPCKKGCIESARQCLSELLISHPYLYSNAIRMFAEYCQVEHTDPSQIKYLSLSQWRTSPQEMVDTLEQCSNVAPTLMPVLLDEFDYTPITGLSLATQDAVLLWLCTSSAPAVWRRRAVRRLRAHRQYWSDVSSGINTASAAPRDDGELLDMYNLQVTAWGHCLPLICSYGVDALHRLVSAGHLRDAVHCLAPIMAVMTQSPESIQLTPRFASLFPTLLSAGPTLVQRALGRGGDSGAALLLRCLLTQLSFTAQLNTSVTSLLTVWLHSLWKEGAHLLEVGMLACRQWQHLDRFTVNMSSEDPSSLIQVISQSALNPFLAESSLRSLQETQSLAWQQLVYALYGQKHSQNSIHVDNALKLLELNLTSEELVIHKTAAAVLVAPPSSPALYALWCLFFNLYLQRPPNSRNDLVPVGPLLFSGFKKSRVLSQLKKKLQSHITYHCTQEEIVGIELKNMQRINSINSKTDKPKSTNESIPEKDLIQSLTLSDLTGESNESIESDENEDNDRLRDWGSIEKSKQMRDLLQYHVMVKTEMTIFLSWLNDGDKVCGVPQMVKYLPEDALEAACKAELERLQPPYTPDDDDFIPRLGMTELKQPIYHRPPHQNMIERLQEYRQQTLFSRKPPRVIKSPIKEVDFSNPRHVVVTVRTLMDQVRMLANDWSREVNRISALDNALWTYVASLRVRRQLTPRYKSCSKGCAPTTIILPGCEWAKSIDAPESVRENRACARTSIRTLARPRPQAARTIAALHSIVNKIRSESMATSVLDLIWQYIDEKCENCPLAKSVLANLTTSIAEKWISPNISLSCQFVTKMFNQGSLNSLHQAALSSVVDPRRLRTDWTELYGHLLRGRLPASVAFCCLSKFEMARLAQISPSAKKEQVLTELINTVTNFTDMPDESDLVLLELLGVHIVGIVEGKTLTRLVIEMSKAAANNKVHPSIYAHFKRAVHEHVQEMTLDDLGNLLTSLGAVWWQARPHIDERCYSDVATHFGDVIGTLLAAAVMAGRALSYTDERVAAVCWPWMMTAWLPWVVPVRTTVIVLRPVVTMFCDDVRTLMESCQGSEPYILQEVFEWVHHLLPTDRTWSNTDRDVLFTLLYQLEVLPWLDYPWYTNRCLQSLIKVRACPPQARAWSCARLAATTSEQWASVGADLHGVLVAVAGLPVTTQTIDEVCKLDWSRLPKVALISAMEQFFVDYYNSTVPYHDLPQFKLILQASELRPHPVATTHHHLTHTGHPDTPHYLPPATTKRLSAAALWVRAASAPALKTSVGDAVGKMLAVVGEISPYCVSGEVEALLSRFITIMCTEPAGREALTVWQKWLKTAPPPLVRSCLSAVCTLTVYDYYLAIAETNVEVHMLTTGSSGWPELTARWSQSPWRTSCVTGGGGGSSVTGGGGGSSVTGGGGGGSLHVTYGTHVAGVGDEGLANIFRRLAAANINFIESETIVAVWVCAACRTAWLNANEASSPNEASVASEAVVEASESTKFVTPINDVVEAAESLLATWSTPSKKSLFQAMTLKSCADKPTYKIQALCWFAQCVLNPSNEQAKTAYSSAIISALGSDPTGLASWSRRPHPRRLPTLALRLFPRYDVYFKYELDLAPEEA